MGGAAAVSDAVVPPQVGGRLGARQDVIHRQGELQLGQVEPDDLGSQGLVGFHRRFHGGLHLGAQTLHVFPGHADLHAPDVLLQTVADWGVHPAPGGGIHRIVKGDRVVHGSRVGHR